jgi:glucans biosynthesis protein C
MRATMLLLGLVLHAAQMYLQLPLAPDYYWDAQRSIVMDVLLIIINTFRMPAFYMLNGFFTALLIDRKGVDGMWRNRVDRILVPFLVFMPPLAISMTLLRIYAHNWQSHGALSLSTAWVGDWRHLLDNTHNLWFLYYLFMFVLVVRCLMLPASSPVCAWVRGTQAFAWRPWIAVAIRGKGSEPFN